jgi:hypothetical protein
MNRRFLAATPRVFLAVVLLGAFATGLAACSPGYMKASELESKHQGPSDCEARCVELGMRMGALVLVSDTLPGCVCQPKPPPVEAPKPGQAPPPTPTPDVSPQGASAATTGYVVAMAAAAAARASQTQQQRQQQQNYIPK